MLKCDFDDYNIETESPNLFMGKEKKVRALKLGT